MECPICNTVIDDTRETPFCPTCHWELVVIPSNVSAAMKRYFEGRRDTFLGCYSSIKAKQAKEQELKKLKNDNSALKKKISAAKTTLQQKRETLKRMESVLVDLESTRCAIRSVQEENARMRELATQSQNYQGDMVALVEAYEKVVRLGCANQVKEVRSFLKNKGVIK